MAHQKSFLVYLFLTVMARNFSPSAADCQAMFDEMKTTGDEVSKKMFQPPCPSKKLILGDFKGTPFSKIAEAGNCKDLFISSVKCTMNSEGIKEIVDDEKGLRKKAEKIISDVCDGFKGFMERKDLQKLNLCVEKDMKKFSKELGNYMKSKIDPTTVMSHIKAVEKMEKLCDKDKKSYVNSIFEIARITIENIQSSMSSYYAGWKKADNKPRDTHFSCVKDISKLMSTHAKNLGQFLAGK